LALSHRKTKRNERSISQFATLRSNLLFRYVFILNIISPTCEDCYVNLNKWELIASQNKKLQKKIIFLVIGDEFERLDEIIKQNKDF